jgi:cytochrome P450
MEFNPFDPAVRADPYPYYDELRRNHPVYRIEQFGAYAVTRHDDVTHLVMHPEVFSSTGMGTTTIHEHETAMLISCDPPDHTRLRNLVNRAFTPRMVEGMEPRIREIANALIDRVLERGEMDFVADFAVPLPMTIIAEILGVEQERQADFKRWSTATVSGDVVEGSEERDRQMDEFVAYFEEAIERCRREPGGDLISALVRAEVEQQALTAEEVITFALLLLVAGNETTTNLIGNLVLALLEHPEQLALVRDDPSLIPNAVEESLRHDAPVQFLFRKALEDVELAGTAIAKDELVLPFYGAANRDERRYPDAERFDITRDTQGHLGFGHGIHFCLGAPLARLEGRIALETVLARLHGLRRSDEGPVDIIDSPFLRGPKRLPLAFEPSKARAAARS